MRPHLIQILIRFSCRIPIDECHRLIHRSAVGSRTCLWHSSRIPLAESRVETRNILEEKGLCKRTDAWRHLSWECWYCADRVSLEAIKKLWVSPYSVDRFCAAVWFCKCFFFFFCALSSNLPGTDYSFKCSKLKDLYASIAIHKVIYALPPAISKGTVTSDRLIADPF